MYKFGIQGIGSEFGVYINISISPDKEMEICGQKKMADVTSIQRFHSQGPKGDRH